MKQEPTKKEIIEYTVKLGVQNLQEETSCLELAEIMNRLLDCSDCKNNLLKILQDEKQRFYDAVPNLNQEQV